MKSAIELCDEAISDLKPQATTPPKNPPLPPKSEKWSRENHPAFKNPPPPAEGEFETPVSYQVNDEVSAKWVSGDKAFYPARITSITGSSADPIYIVTFKGYGNTETLRSRDIKPIQKRKTDNPAPPMSAPNAPAPPPPAPSTSVAPPPPPPPASPSSNGVVFSAAANLYPESVLEAKRAAEQQGEGAPKKKKIKTKELERGKNKWKEFSTKSKFGKTQKKDSMFRTPEGIHGRGM